MSAKKTKVCILYGGYLKNGGGVVTHIKELQLFLHDRDVNVEVFSMDSISKFFQFAIIGSQFLLKKIDAITAYKIRMLLTRFVYFYKIPQSDYYFLEDYMFIYKKNKGRQTLFLHALKVDNMYDYIITEEKMNDFLNWEKSYLKDWLDITYTVSKSYSKHVASKLKVDDIKVINNFINFNGEVANLNKPVSRNILFVGNLEERKNPFFFIDVLSKMRESFDTAFIVGREVSISYEQLKIYAESKLINDKIKFLHQVNKEQLFKLMDKCDVLAMPSLKESFGFVMLEAKLNNMKVIASHGLEVPNELVDKFCHLNVNDWVLCLTELLNRDNSTSIDKEVLENFTQEYFQRKIIENDIFNSLMVIKQ